MEALGLPGFLAPVALVIGALLALFGVIKITSRQAEKKGRAEAELEVHTEAQNKIHEAEIQEREDRLEAVDEQVAIEDRLDSDPVYRKRVRDRFSRD